MICRLHILLPALFCLRLLPGRLSRTQAGVCWALLPLSGALMVAGVLSSGVQLWAEAQSERGGS